MPTIGEQLKQARLDRNLSLKQVVQSTRIRAHYLEAFEADDLSALPSPAQARGFLRLYAEFLQLNPDDMLRNLRGEVEHATIRPEGVAAPAPLEESSPDPEISPSLPIETEANPEIEPPITATEDSAPAAQPLSQRLFHEIGALLRERRELLSLTLEEIERHIHVRQHHLEKIEAGQFDDLPSPVQARGMLNSYASFLDMNADSLLLRFAEALQARRAENQPKQTTRPRPNLRTGQPSLLGRLISPDLIFGGSMILTLLGLSIWGTARLFSINAPAPASATSGPSISEILLATPLGGETPTQELIPTSVPELATAIATTDPGLLPPTETATPIQAFTPSSAVQLTIIVLERTFLRVTVDGVVQQEGRVAPGAALSFDGNERIEVLTGSGAALQIVYNQQDLGVLGNFGDVVDRIYTRTGIQTPTATVSPTASSTPRQTPIPTPTQTPRPTQASAP
jgi:cytoskeletal protein RodZ